MGLKKLKRTKFQKGNFKINLSAYDKFENGHFAYYPSWYYIGFNLPFWHPHKKTVLENKFHYSQKLKFTTDYF